MSNDRDTAYLHAAAALLGLPIRPEDFADVLAAWKAIAVQAQLVTEFPLPAAIEAAPRFRP